MLCGQLPKQDGLVIICPAVMLLSSWDTDYCLRGHGSVIQLYSYLGLRYRIRNQPFPNPRSGYCSLCRLGYTASCGDRISFFVLIFLWLIFVWLNKNKNSNFSIFLSIYRYIYIQGVLLILTIWKIAVTLLLFGIFPIWKKILVIKIWTFCCMTFWLKKCF